MIDTPLTLIVGAGLSGLAAARALADAGRRVLVLDKGRGVGGRLATRRVEVGETTLHFDHGAQYFTARDPDFRAAVEAWQEADVADIWADDFPATGDRAGKAHAHYPRYRGTDGMAGIAKHLAAGLEVESGVRVVKLTPEANGWLVECDTGERFHAADLILTPPVPQSLALLSDSGLTLDDELLAGLRKVEFAPCLSVMVTLDGPSAVPAPGGVFAGPEPVSWVADNTQKGLSPVGHSAVTVHAGPEISRAHYKSDEADVTAALLDATRGYLGAASVVTTKLHRWLYSLPTVVYPARHAEWVGSPAGRVIFAGDAFEGPRIEGAYLSGRSAAAALLHGTGTT